MTLKQFPLDGTSGADVVAADAGFSMINKAGGTIKYGTRGIVFTSAAAGSYTIARANAAGSNIRAGFRGSFMLPALPPGDLPIAQIRGGIGDERVIAPIVRSTGAVTIYDRASGAMPGSLGVITPGTWYDLALIMTAGSTTAGAYTAQLFQDSSDTAHAPAGSSTTSNLTANPIDGFELGICTFDLTASTAVHWDNVQIDDGATTNIPVYAEPEPVFNAFFGQGGVWKASTLYFGDGTWQSITGGAAG